MAKLVVLLVCLAAFQASWALKCKKCQDINDISCKTLEDESCPSSTSNQEPACLVHIYKPSKDSKEEIIEKKCVNRGKDGKYDCVKHSSAEVEIKCSTCTDNFCNEKNAATQISLGSIALVACVAFFVPKLL